MRYSLITIGLLATLTACSTSATNPSSGAPAVTPGGSSMPPPVTLGGIYAGSVSDSTGSGMMTWTVSQSGASVSAPVTATTPLGTVAFNGSLAGSLSDTSLTFT